MRSTRQGGTGNPLLSLVLAAWLLLSNANFTKGKRKVQEIPVEYQATRQAVGGDQIDQPGLVSTKSRKA